MNNKPEEFYSEPTEQMTQQYHLINYKEIDVKKLIKSCSLSLSAIVFGTLILIKTFKHLSTMSWILPKAQPIFQFPKLPFSYWAIVLGLVCLFPYIAIVLYDYFNKDEDDTKKEVKNVRESGR